MCKHCKTLGLADNTTTWYELGWAWLLLILTYVVLGSVSWAAYNYAAPALGLPVIRYAEGLALFVLVRVVGGGRG